jgi:hypothetical protein
MVRRLQYRVDAIAAEQKYSTDREEEMRNTNESTNGRVLWWSVTTTFMVILAGFWQLRSLRRFFERKKLI